MPVTGNNSNNNLVFQGTLVANFGATFVNPYSGDSVFVDGLKNVNNTTYDGLGGTDTLIMSNIGDVLLIDTGTGSPTVQNIERFVAGAGGDVVFLADDTFVLGNVFIDGGAEDDLIWANAGDDTVNGFSGDDIIDTGPGNDTANGGIGNDRINGGDGQDTLNGDDGNDLIWGDSGHDILSAGSGEDTLYGGFGSDTLQGGDGDDTLYGGNGPGDNPDDFTHEVVLSHSFVGVAYLLAEDRPSNTYIPPQYFAVEAQNLAISYATTITMTYVFSSAGYRNSLGAYVVAADGTIENVEMAFKNQHQIAYGTEFTYDFRGDQGDALGFFLIANGWSVDANLRNVDLSTGDLHFIYDFGGVNERVAKVTDDGNLVSLVFDNGTIETKFNVTTYHTSLAGEGAGLNPDGYVHTLSSLANPNDPNTLRIGFEDLYNLGDADFEDVLFDVTVASQSYTILGDPDNDTLNGGAGNDTLYGGFGDDILFAGLGADHLYGGAGDDVFAFTAMDNALDYIYDFEVGAGKDVLNLTDILSGYDPLTDALNNFVRLAEDGGNTVISVNADGDIGGAFQQVVAFDGGIGSISLATLLSNGNLVLDHSAV